MQFLFVSGILIFLVLIARSVALLLGNLLGHLVAVVLGDILAPFDRVVCAGLTANGNALLDKSLGLGIVANFGVDGLAVCGVHVLLDL